MYRYIGLIPLHLLPEAAHLSAVCVALCAYGVAAQACEPVAATHESCEPAVHLPGIVSLYCTYMHCL